MATSPSLNLAPGDGERALRGGLSARCGERDLLTTTFRSSALKGVRERPLLTGDRLSLRNGDLLRRRLGDLPRTGDQTARRTGDLLTRCTGERLLRQRGGVRERPRRSGGERVRDRLRPTERDLERRRIGGLLACFRQGEWDLLPLSDLVGGRPSLSRGACCSLPRSVVSTMRISRRHSESLRVCLFGDCLSCLATDSRLSEGLYEILTCSGGERLSASLAEIALVELVILVAVCSAILPACWEDIWLPCDSL